MVEDPNKWSAANEACKMGIDTMDLAAKLKKQGNKLHLEPSESTVKLMVGSPPHSPT